MPRSMPDGQGSRLLLYVTRGCHLCDEAAALLEAAGARWYAREIGYDAALVARYGTRIPVLRRSDTGAELDWPFAAPALAAFLR
jgi:hypothetical protein